MILITGFEPFANFPNNLSKSICLNLNQVSNFSMNFKIHILPVSWKRSLYLYKKALNSLEVDPTAVVLLGIHESNKISLEKFAINFSCGIDNDNQIRTCPISYNLPIIKKTLFPIDSLYSFLGEMMDVRISYFPGFYLCNFIYYWALALAENRYPVLFIHLPARGNKKEYLKKFILILRLIKFLF